MGSINRTQAMLANKTWFLSHTINENHLLVKTLILFNFQILEQL